MPRKHRFTEHQMIEAIKQMDSGVDRSEICRRLGINDRTLFKWRAKFAGMQTADIHRLRHLETENAQLKKLLAEAELDKSMLQAVIKKK
jgi:putative transposase